MNLAKKEILTPVLRYWGFMRHPFAGFVLRGSDLGLFVNREMEIRRLHNALSNPLCGAYGAQGIGKSTLLEHLKERVEAGGYTVVLVQMTGTSENLLYREILASVLGGIKDKRIKVPSTLKLDVEKEIQRIQTSIKHVSGVETGLEVKLVLGTGTTVSEIDEQEVPRHTEDSALDLVALVAEHAKSPFAVIVDNLERAKSLIKTEEEYFRFVARFARTIDERMSASGIPFVVSLDRSFVEHVQNQLPGDEEALSFSFGALIPVQRFSPDDLWAIVERRLDRFGWKKEASSFLTADAFWALAMTAEGHPRRTFAVLREAMELIADEKAQKQITFEFVRRAAENCRETVDEVSLRILAFLGDGKAHSPSEARFSEAVDIAPSTLRGRVAELSEKDLLRAERVQDGRARRVLYSLPPLESHD